MEPKPALEAHPCLGNGAILSSLIAREQTMTLTVAVLFISGALLYFGIAYRNAIAERLTFFADLKKGFRIARQLRQSRGKRRRNYVRVFEVRDIPDEQEEKRSAAG